MRGVNRRRFLTIVAGAAALPGASPATPAPYRWRGIALGAPASITLDNPEAPRLVAEALAEIIRLEGIFSLYRTDSALMRLNATGRLAEPPPELLELLGLCGAIHRATEGYFDPTIQPLWALFAESYTGGAAPDADSIATARERVGWREVRYSAAEVGFGREGMALSLNGIAQGYICDRVAALLAAEGLTDALIDPGEIRALGNRPGGGPWRVGLADTPGALPLRDRAVATSAPQATVFDEAGRIGHIFDPHTGRPGALWQSVTVTAPHAAVADALSTAFCLMDRAMIEQALSVFPDAQLAALG
jgi:thiamine biosynthesis lipoprotein